jgi:hypothetical protein
MKNGRLHTVKLEIEFHVMEDDLGRPFLYLEPRYGGPRWVFRAKPHDQKPGTVLFQAGAVFSFDLEPGTSVEEAEEIADYLNERLRTMHCTTIWEVLAHGPELDPGPSDKTSEPMVT